MAELADALDSKSGDSNIVWVQAPLRPPIHIIHDIINIWKIIPVGLILMNVKG